MVALGASGFAALHSPLLSARHLTVRGGPHETRATVLAVTGLSHHPPLIDIDTARDATAIDALPYVLRASVVRNWPEGVTVTIVERTPVGWVARKAGGFAIVDRSGRVLGFTVATPTAGGLTALTDVGPVPGAGRFLGASGAAVAALAAAVPDGLRGYVRSVGALSSEDLDLRLNSGATALFGGVTALSAKFVALATLIASAPTAVRAARLIDLRDPTSPVLTP